MKMGSVYTNFLLEWEISEDRDLPRQLTFIAITISLCLAGMVDMVAGSVTKKYNYY